MTALLWTLRPAITLLWTAGSMAVLVALAGALTAGCGSSCDDAAEHEAECGFDTREEESGSASCDGAVECASGCSNDAPCGAFDGTDSDARTAYLECLDACTASAVKR